MKKYHYYIGLQLPSNVRNQIAALQHKLFDPIESIEPLEPHITLLPPPAVEHIKPEDLAMHSKAAAKDVWPLSLTLSDMITFSGHGVAIRAESEAIHDLQRRLVALLPFAAEVTYYPHPQFLPHVTLAQAIRGKKLPAKLIERYGQELEMLLPVTFTVGHLTLFEWTGPRKYQAKPI
jgi:2'-5' RNA ligase